MKKNDGFLKRSAGDKQYHEWAHPERGSKLGFDLFHYQLRTAFNIGDVSNEIYNLNKQTLVQT